MRVFVDASFDNKSKQAQIGVVALNRSIPESHAVLCHNTPSSHVSELTALITAIRLANELNWDVQSFTSDNQSLIEAIHSNHLSTLIQSVPHAMQSEVQLLPALHRLVPFQWLPRSKNALADVVSRTQPGQAVEFNAYMQILAAEQPCYEFLLRQSSRVQQLRQRPVRLQPVEPGMFLAHETYMVDAVHGRCTCPEFDAFSTCAHLETAVTMFERDTVDLKEPSHGVIQ